MSRVHDSADVILNVYDASPLNKWTYHLGLGKFHSGIEIYGIEYAYGPVDGVMNIDPKSGVIKNKVTFRTSLKLGETTKSRSEVRDLINDIDDHFLPDQYDPFSQNSNHFTDRVAGRLCHTTIPQWVNSIPDLAAFSYFYPKLRLFSVVNENEREKA